MILSFSLKKSVGTLFIRLTTCSLIKLFWIKYSILEIFFDINDLMYSSSLNFKEVAKQVDNYSINWLLLIIRLNNLLKVLFSTLFWTKIKFKASESFLKIVH